MSTEELAKLGISQADYGSSQEWNIAGSDASPETIRALSKVFEEIGVEPGYVCSLGCGWYVDRRDFFRVRRALLLSPRVRAIPSFEITTPTFMK